MNKLKDILIFLVSVFVILLLGFVPIAPKALLALDWENLGVQMVEAGVIDQEKFENLHNQKGGLTDTEREWLYGENNRHIAITSENSEMALHMLWAFGLGNKNRILENGPMMDPRYGGAGGFASTGGWTLSNGNSMEHYSIHSFVTLSETEQVKVERVAKNIFRPCCTNSTYFPDCNHGMAMLGLLELMASEGASEADMYKAAEELNEYWFGKQEKKGCGA